VKNYVSLNLILNKTMKKITTFLFISILSVQVWAQQEANKPQYQLACYRFDPETSLDTLIGNIEIELFPLIAPKHVRNFDSLVSVQFYDSTAFHRVVPGFVIQGGDPNSRSGPTSTWGFGQSGQPTVPAEFSVARHHRGRMGAARSTNINSATSQFYFSVANTYNLDESYTVYGQLMSGHAVMDNIVGSPRTSNDRPIDKISMFITKIGEDPSIPEAPTLTTPAHGATNVLLTSTFQWTNVTDGVIYTMEISTDSLFTDIVATKKFGVNSGTPPNTLAGSTTYFWRIITNNGGHYSEPSQVSRFKSAAGVPTLIFPSNNSNNITISPLCNWSDVPNSTYHYQLSTTTNFINGTILIDTNGLTVSEYQLSNLNSATAYFWRARSFDGENYSNWPVRARFVTETVNGINENQLVTNSIKIYPNPAKEVLVIEVTENAIIQIVDLTGKEIITKNITVGVENIAINHLAKGMYFVKISSGKNHFTEKITLE
jgi:peptidyl-prolyl cis-trans isomerase B (cyclophilin B)